MGRDIANGYRYCFLVTLLTVGLLGQGGNCWCYDTTLNQMNSAASVDFSFDNLTFMAVDSGNKQVNFWRMDTKELIYTYNASSQPTCAKFSKDGTIIGIGLSNNDVLLLNANTYTFNTTIPNPAGGPVVELDFSWKTANSLIVCSSGTIKFINYAGTVAWTVSNSNIVSCKLNKLDGLGYSYSNNFKWHLYNTAASTARESNGGGDDYGEVDFSMENSSATAMRLVSGNTDNRFYTLTSGQNSANQMFSSNQNGNAACYSRDNNFFAGGDSSGKLYILNVTDRIDYIFQIMADAPSIDHCRFNYDTKYLAASTGSNGNIYIYTTNCFSTNTKCQQGYYDNNGVCTTCSSIVGCLACSGSTTCSACSQGFYLAGTTCNSCTSIANCRSCESNSKCTECQHGYFLNYSSNACVTCESSIRGCISCYRNSTNTTVFCRTCHTEYYLNSTDYICYSCVSNNPNCLRCFTSAICLECQLSFYLDATNVCQPCTGNCLVCTSSSSCIACIKGYRSVSGTCTVCTANCLDCQNSGTCTSCSRGYFISGGSCSVCTLPCLTCVTSATNCLICAVGYYSNGAGTCIRCNSNCVTCTTSTACNSCEIGYYLTGTNTCAICSGITANCTTCNTTQCFSCQNSYYLSASFTCLTCLSSLSGCLACTSSTACLQCFVGYYLTGNTCTTCPSQCESCTTSTSCNSCAIGYYLSGTTCSQCVANCVTCSSSTNCLSCQTGYFLDTSATPNVCAKCLLSLLGCVSCNSSTVCIECQLGRYFSAGNCSFCPINCSTCNSTVCLSCSVGYYLTGSTCSKCQQNCSECTTATLCSSCNTGFYLDTSLASNNCLSCTGLGCETCSINTCLSCQIGYYLSSTSCVTCNTTLPNCYACSQTLCLQCMYGYYSNAGSCALCVGVLNGCTSCTNNTVCTECTVGYYLQAANNCTSCPVQCKTCKNNVCTTCQMQYTFNAGLTDCLLCESYMTACLSCSSTTICNGCYEGYYLTAGNICASCRSSITGCLSCSSSSTCLVCQDKYYLVGGICTNCNSIQSCAYCQSSSVCLACFSGYYLNSGNTCSLCTTSLVGCLFCSSSSFCQECQTGYFLNTATHQCQLCVNSIQGCLTCSSATTCLDCDGGYYLDTGSFICKSCNVVGCEVCGDTSPGVCISCSLGYYLTGTTCTACSQNACLECSAASTCLRCDSGYYLSGSSCVSCKSSITACSKCVSSTVCAQCDSTYYLDSSSHCSQCSSTLAFCEICTSSSSCTVCSSGYYSQGGTCTSCASISGCFMCISASACQNCVNGYYLSGTTCTSCSSSLANCYQCNSPTTCLSCLSGYVLDTSGICNQVTAGSAPAPLPIPMLAVKTYYVSSTQLKHVMYTKQSYSFTKQSLTWSSVTTISLYNSAARATISLTISSVEWGPGLTSLIFYTNNPLNLSADALAMPFARLLLTQQDISFSYQTKFQMTKSALELLMPDQVIPNDFTQQSPLMEPSFYLSYLQTSGEFYLSIIGFVIVGALFINFFVRTTCTASHSRNIGEIVPHILALKTCALMVFPIYPQIASFCYGLMAADLPWFGQYFSSLSYSGDVLPAGFQLYYTNMNFSSLYLAPFVLYLLLLLLGYLTLSQPRKKNEVFSLHEEEEHNRSSYAYLRMIFVYFSFGATFAGAASVQGALYNPSDSLSVNGAFYMLGGIVYCVQLAVSVFLTRKEGRSCYIRSFLKATLLSVAHISPVYICTLAVTLDLSLVFIEYRKHKQAIKYPKLWVVKHVLANLALLLLYYLNSKKIALMTVIAISFLSILIEFGEHISDGSTEQQFSKRVKPVDSGKDRNSEFHDEKNATIQYFMGDLKLHEGKEADIVDHPLGDTRTTFKDSKGFSSEFIFDEDDLDHDSFPAAEKTKSSHTSEKRHRPFRARKKEAKIETIFEKDNSSRQQ